MTDVHEKNELQGSTGDSPVTDEGRDSGKSTASKLPDDVLLIIPVRNMVLFPGVVLPVSVGRKGSIAAAQEAARQERKVGFLLQKDPSVNEPGPGDLHHFGTVANLLRYVTTQDGGHHIVCEGEQRFRVVDFIEGHPYLLARIDLVEEKDVESAEVEARLHYLKQQASEAMQMLPQVPSELINTIQGITSASAMADLVANFLDLKPEEKQELLETLDVKKRLDKVVDKLGHQVEVLRLSREIDKQTKESLNERQREVLLREQLKTIQKELGEEGTSSEVKALDEAIAKARMPAEVEVMPARN